MVDDGRGDMKGDGDGWYLWCCTRRRRPTRCQFLLCLFTWESPFGGVCIHMQYIIHGLYFLCINIKKDRFLFPWCHSALRDHCVRSPAFPRSTQHHLLLMYVPHHLKSFLFNLLFIISQQCIKTQRTSPRW